MAVEQRITEIVESSHHDHDCPDCGAELDSRELQQDSLSGTFSVPVFCSECGFEGIQSYSYNRTERVEQVPEELICILDTRKPSGRDLADGYGEIVHGLVIIREVLDTSRECAQCGAQHAYVLEECEYGGALCREHLQKQPMTAAIVEEEATVKQFELPEAPVREGGA